MAATEAATNPVAVMVDGLSGLIEDLAVAIMWLRNREDVLSPHVVGATLRVERLIHSDARTDIRLQCLTTEALAACTRLLLAGDGQIDKQIDDGDGAVLVRRSWGRVSISAWAPKHVVCDRGPDGAWDCGPILAHLDTVERPWGGA